jgi:adenylate kinase
MFRAAIAQRTDLGLTVEPLLANGILVPDDVTIALIRARLGEPDAAGGFVLDGFPRNLAQAEALDALLADIGHGLDAILFFDISDEVAMKRALGRARDENRDDDTHDVITRRLATYHAETEPVVEHYRATGKLVPLHGERTIDEVWTEVSNALQQVGDPA